VEVTSPRTSSQARKDLVVRLVSAIKEDLDIIRREEHESAIREEGFWRWAGKGAYYQIMWTREEFDWATGQKKGTLRRGSSADDETESDINKEDISVKDVTVEIVAKKTVQRNTVLKKTFFCRRT